MRKKPNFWLTLFGSILVMVVVYFSVYTLASNEEIVKSEIIEVPIQTDVLVGKEIFPNMATAEVEVKGTYEMFKELEERSPYILVGLTEREEDLIENQETEGDVGGEENGDKLETEGDNGGENTGDEIGDSGDISTETLENEVNLADLYDTEIEVSNLDGFIYTVLSEVTVDIQEVEGEELDLKVKVKGIEGKEIQDIKIKGKVIGYLTEADKEVIDEIAVYIDVSEIKGSKVMGEVKIIDNNGEELDLEGRVDKEEVQVEVKYKEVKKGKDKK